MVAGDLAHAVLVFGIIFARDLYALVLLLGAAHPVNSTIRGRLLERGEGRGLDEGQRPHRRHLQRLFGGDVPIVLTHEAHVAVARRVTFGVSSAEPSSTTTSKLRWVWSGTLPIASARKWARV
jgi:hypothetical protein